MASQFAELAKLNKEIGALYDENQFVYPEIDQLPVKPIEGTEYSTIMARDTQSGEFTHVGEGINAVNTEFSEKKVQCFPYKDLVIAPKEIANGFKGYGIYPSGPAGFMMLQARRVLKNMLKNFGSQIFYGTAAPVGSKGFPGFLQHLDTVNMQVTAGSSASSDTSLWAVFPSTDDGVCTVVGNARDSEGNARDPFTLSDVYEQVITKDNKSVPSYVQDLVVWLGVQVNHPQSLGRVQRIATTGSSNRLTDILIGDLMVKFPASFWSGIQFYVNRAGLASLTASRSAVGQAPYSQGANAAFASEAFNRPVIVTDTILSAGANS